MSGKLSFYFLVLVLIFSACKNNEQNNIVILNNLNESLEASTRNIEYENESILKALEQRRYEFRTAEQGNFWQPKAVTIDSLSSNISGYISNLKSELKKIDTKKNTLDLNDKSAVQNLMYKKNKSGELYTKLKKFQQDIWAVDNEVNEHFKLLMPVTLKFDIKNQDSSDFFNAFFKNSSLVSTLATLSSFQNNIKIIEYSLNTYCLSKTAFTGCVFTKYMPLISQSHTHIKAGESIEITAGIGAYTTEMNRQVNINGKNIELKEGVVKYKLQGVNEIGKHTVPITISFKDQNGVDQTAIGNIEYTVDE